MPTWNLHIVASKAIEDVGEIGAEIVAAVEGHGHELVSAVLTTDEGSQDITPPPAAEEAPAEEAQSETPPAEVPVDTPPAAT